MPKQTTEDSKHTPDLDAKRKVLEADAAAARQAKLDEEQRRIEIERQRVAASKADEERKVAWASKYLRAGSLASLAGLKVRLDYDTKPDDLQAGRAIGRILRNLGATVVSAGPADIFMGLRVSRNELPTIGNQRVEVSLSLQCQLLDLGAPCFLEPISVHGSANGLNVGAVAVRAVDDSVIRLEHKLIGILSSRS